MREEVSKKEGRKGKRKEERKRKKPFQVES